MLSRLSELRFGPWFTFRSSAIVVGLALCGSGQGQAQPHPYRSLLGLKAVHVFVIARDQALKDNGLREPRLEDVVKKRLRRAGIPISEDPNAPTLVLYMTHDVTSALKSRGLPVKVFWYARLALRQNVLLKRDRRILSYSETWSKDALGRIKPSDVPWLEDEAEKLVNEFVIDYLRANQRP